MSDTMTAPGPTDQHEVTEDQVNLRHKSVPDTYYPEPGEVDDPNSYFRTGVAGGAQPQDEGFYTPPVGTTSETPVGDPPTPPAALPEDEGDEDERDPLLHLLGNRKLGVKVGGFKPDSTVLKIKGGAIDVDGQFDMGDRFPAVFDLQVTGNLDRHSIELESGTIKASKRAQEATICGTTTLEIFLERHIEDETLLAAVRTALGFEETE